MLVERPGYRIDNRSIKRGSRPSILIVSFMESSNLCILGIIFIGSLFDSYRGVVLVLVVLVMTRPSSPKTVFVCVFYCVFGVEDFVGSSLWKVSLFHLLERSPLLGFNIFTFYRVAFVVLFPTKLDSLDSDFICKSYGCSGFTVWIWSGDGPESPVQRTRTLRSCVFRW